MSIEQAVLEKLQALPLNKQQEVLDFAEFLCQKLQKTEQVQASEPEYVPKTPLSQRLKELRQQAIASGMQLASAEELEGEMAGQRNRHQNLYEDLH
jgi:hypothetical protein